MQIQLHQPIAQLVVLYAKRAHCEIKGIASHLPEVGVVATQATQPSVLQLLGAPQFGHCLPTITKRILSAPGDAADVEQGAVCVEDAGGDLLKRLFGHIGQVWDTGIGIANEHIDRIFEEFYQIDNPERDRNKGLGLGLAIVRRIGELLGTKVFCESRLGKGTVFSLWLPLYNPQAHGTLADRTAVADSKVDLAALEGKRCLVLEDDEQLAGALDIWLRSFGAVTERYSNAETALAMGGIEAADYFIVDFRLAGTLDGISFLNETQRRLSRPIQAVLITGDTSPEFVAMAKASRWPVLYKPVEPSRLAVSLLSTRPPTYPAR